jgi:peptidoglycan/LPS O-acetylase OafA/YrhL
VIALAALLGLVLYFAERRLGSGQGLAPQVAVTATLLSLLMLPYLSGRGTGDQIFPMIPALWSLFFEFVVNIVYACFHRHLGNKRLIAIVAVSGGVAAFWGFAGDSTYNFPLGFVRVAFGFFLGVLLFRLRAAGRLPAIRVPLLAAAALILAVMAVPFPIPYAGWAELLLGSAVLILGVANSDGGAWTRRVSLVLGALSYPLYLLHQPLIGFAKAALGAQALTAGAAAGILAGAGLAAWLVARFYETPVRRWLGRVAWTAPRGAATA